VIKLSQDVIEEDWIYPIKKEMVKRLLW